VDFGGQWRSKMIAKVVWETLYTPLQPKKETMVHCPQCNGEKLHNRGTRLLTNGQLNKRMSCNECKIQFTVSEDGVPALPQKSVHIQKFVEYVNPEKYSNSILKAKILLDRRVVITSVKNGTEVDENFLAVLQNYISIMDCSLLAIPVRHKNIGEDYNPNFDEAIVPYLFEDNLNFEDHGIKILGSLKISSSIENPLAGLDPISKGASLIVGHPQLQLRTLPRIRETYPAIVTTTGSVSKKNYTPSKAGTKADFNHSLSAAVIEFDGGFVHIRHLNFDVKTKTFTDLSVSYSADSSDITDVEALITGDEHVIHKDDQVAQTTYSVTNPKSLVNVLRPKNIVRHDVFDSYSISHHHEKNVFMKFKKFTEGTCKVEDELTETINFINDTTPSYAVSWIVQSNHNEHLTRWLTECDPKLEPWNAKVYHQLMYRMLCLVEEGKMVDAFQLYSRDLLNKNIQFADRDADLYIKEILLSSHGDAGTNGSRGTRKQFSMIPTKSIIGHSHSPGIEKGCYQVGTSSKLKLEYNIGASSWHHTHCIIHKNGKRQLIFITNGKYCI
jgi:transposase-like protein